MIYKKWVINYFSNQTKWK